MLILALDTASPSGSLAVLRGEKVIGVVATDMSETYSSRMFRQLDFLLAELRLAHDAFDLLAVNAGPGSFTGLRVGLTAAKAWAEVYGKPVVPVSGLQAVAEQSCGEGLLLPLLDARRGEVYFGLYDRSAVNLSRRDDDRVGTPDEFLSTVAAEQNPRVASPDFGAFGDLQKRLRDQGASCETVSPVLAPVVGRLAYQAAQRGQVVDALALDANYVRRSDAELHWKGHT